MLEELLQFDLPVECWLEFFSNINPIVREELEWQLDDEDYYSQFSTWANLYNGYKQFLAQEELFSNKEYQNMLEVCNKINNTDIVFVPGRARYWQDVYEFLQRLFHDVPALSVEKDSLLKSEDRTQVYNETKTSGELCALANKIAFVSEEASENGDAEPVSEEVAKFRMYVLEHPGLFRVGEQVSDVRTDYTLVYKRRAILKSCMKSIEFLLRKYESGKEPTSWRRL